MAYQVLARKYRPLRFSDVVGQDHVTRTLLNALGQERIAHGYIFSGHRGIGKTTIARILASALNCRNAIGSEVRPTAEPCNACESCLEIRQGNAVDVIEIDAATNRGIDEIRELRDAARYRPSRDKYKIYILDEAHQITDAAFNALLKTLEEPPDHIVFMMATTQPEDIPQTIRSRCQHYSFHAVKLDDIVGQLRLISTNENILVDDGALALLAEAGDGSMRDALSIMDQAIASAPIQDGKPFARSRSDSRADGHCLKRDLRANSRSRQRELERRRPRHHQSPPGRWQRSATACAPVRTLFAQLHHRERSQPWLTRRCRDRHSRRFAYRFPTKSGSRAARSAALFTEEELSRFLSIMLRTFDDLGYRQEQRLHLELGLLKLVHVQRLLPVEELLSQLGASPAKGGPPAPPAKPSAASGPAPSGRTGAASQLNTDSLRTVSVTSQNTRPTPLQSDQSRKTPAASSSISSSAPITAGSLALAQEPVPLPPAKDIVREADRPHLIEPNTPALNSSTAPSDIDTTALQLACIAALGALKGQGSAAHTIEESSFAVSGETLEIRTTVSQAMLPVAINAEADRAIKSALRELGAGALKVKLLPGAAKAASTPRTPRTAAAGSAEELAAKHPLVQQAQQLFGAEISNVIDLRDKN